MGYKEEERGREKGQGSEEEMASLKREREESVKDLGTLLIILIEEQEGEEDQYTYTKPLCFGIERERERKSNSVKMRKDEYRGWRGALYRERSESLLGWVCLLCTQTKPRERERVAECVISGVGNLLIAVYDK